jgi:zinc/manganese transport system substrate-binding protein
MRRLFHPALAVLAAAIALLAPGVAQAADKIAADKISADKIRAVATFSVLADMVRNVAGDHVDLITIVGPDGDTELYEPGAADVPKVANARILFMNGLNDEFEPWLDPLLKQAKFAGTKVIVTRGVKALSSEDEHPVGGRPKAPVLDQHAWLDPRNGIIYVRNITDALARIDPANADDYRARAAAYTQQLRTLDSWAHAEMSAVPASKRRVLASHDSLQYLATAFNITMISVNGWTNKSEPSAADLARLTDQIRREHVKALFLDSITDPRAMERISQETGAVIGGTLYGDALSKPDREAGTYIEMIRHDITTLKAGMLLN